MFITAKRVIRTLMFPLQLLITASYLKNCVVVIQQVDSFQIRKKRLRQKSDNVSNAACERRSDSMHNYANQYESYLFGINDPNSGVDRCLGVAELNSTFESTVAHPSHFNQSYALQLNSTREKCDVQTGPWLLQRGGSFLSSPSSPPPPSSSFWQNTCNTGQLGSRY